MDVPDLVRQAVGDEELRAGVNLGDEDAVLFTPSRALVYRGEGLLSDENVGTYGFDFERLAVSEGRRKTKYTMTYVDAERSFTVPGKRTDDVLEQLVEGMLRVADAIDATESVTGVFRFSEMTIVVTEGRVLKHVGEYTWDSDFEAFDYDDLTKLAFEEGSVATQVVLGVGNRSERIKAPNAEAGLVRKTVQEAVFDHHGVSSLEELNRKIAVEPENGAGQGDATGGLGLDSGIDPLVSEESDEDESRDAGGDTRGSQAGSSGPAGGESQSASASGSTESPDADGSVEQPSGTAASGQPSAGSSRSPSARSSSGSASSQSGSVQSSGSQSSTQSSGSKSSQSRSQSPPSNAAESSSGQSRSRQGSPGANQSTPSGGQSASGSDAGSVPSARSANDEVLEQLADLTQAVERQNELLERQQRTVQQLIEELRQGR